MLKQVYTYINLIIIKGWPIILSCAGISLIVGLLYMIVIRYGAGCMVWYMKAINIYVKRFSIICYIGAVAGLLGGMCNKKAKDMVRINLNNFISKLL